MSIVIIIIAAGYRPGKIVIVYLLTTPGRCDGYNDILGNSPIGLYAAFPTE
jgi:hypothetical protein